MAETRDYADVIRKKMAASPDLAALVNAETLAELLRQECHDFTQRMLAKYRAHTVKFDAAVSLYEDDIAVSFKMRMPKEAPPEPDHKVV